MIILKIKELDDKKLNLYGMRQNHKRSVFGLHQMTLLFDKIVPDFTHLTSGITGDTGRLQMLRRVHELYQISDRQNTGDEDDGPRYQPIYYVSHSSQLPIL